MMPKRFDIRVYKKNLRQHYKGRRRAMPEKEKNKKDEAILASLLRMPEYQKARTVLVYVSMPIEVNTHKLIDTALEQGKTVAVPYCIDGTREMRFYCISSRDELMPRTFGVMEPNPEQARELTNFTGSICILPGLCFDMQGYRLGYGGGYYDRFLSQKYQKHGIKIGVCYQGCTRKSLTHGRYDIACDFVVTESGVRKIAKKHSAFAKKRKQPPKKQKPPNQSGA